MKNLFLLAFVLVLVSCNTDEKETATPTSTAETTTPETKVVLPFKLSYEGTAVIGNPENIKTVMNFNRDFAEGKMENIGSYFADSVHVVFADGAEVNSSRDSAAAMITGWRNTISDIQLSYITAVAVDNKDKGDEWVFQWIDEADNYKDGKKVHHILHEDYRLVNGKIREVFQYSQVIPAPGKK